MNPGANGFAFRFSPTIGPEKILYMEDAKEKSPSSLQSLDLGQGKSLDPDLYLTKVIYVKAEDRFEIPLKFSYKKGTFEVNGENLQLKNEKAVFLLEVYGAYRAVLSPYYRTLESPALQAWLDAGNVYIEDHVRGGGGVSGEAHHQAGQFKNKHVSATDMIASAEFIYKRFSRSAVSLGQSAAGIPLLISAMERPELFSGIVAMDVSADLIGLLSLSAGAGPTNRPELGDPHKKEEFNFIAPISPYWRAINDPKIINKPLPPLYIASSSGDKTVIPFFSSKMAMAWQRGPRSALLVTNEGDHGGEGATLEAGTLLQARMLAFAQLMGSRFK